MDKKILLHFKKVDPILYEVAKESNIHVLIRADDYFLDLVETVISQQLSGKAAATIFTRFKKLLPQEEVTPKNILSLKDGEIRAAGISFSKISYIKGISEAVINKQINLIDFDNETDEIVMEKLIKLKGIGKWSAEMFLMFSLGREDVFSFGDLGLRNAIKKLYKLKTEPTIHEMEKISLKWKPYRTHAARILWKSLES